MRNFFHGILRCSSLVCLALSANVAIGQVASRGTIVVYPTVFDKSGTVTSRNIAEASLKEVLKVSGFKLIDSSIAARAWQSSGIRVPTSTRPPLAKDLTKVGRIAGAQYVVTAQVSFHTRSIWVNLGPKTVSDCHIVATIVDSKSGKVVHEADVSGRSDEKSDNLKVLGSLFLTPLITAVNGGPKTPQESRAGRIAAARSLEDFVRVDVATMGYMGTWQWIRFDGMDDNVIKVKDSSRFVLTLANDGTASGIVDSNRFKGTYSVSGASLKFGELATTKVAVAPDSLQDKFLDGLKNASSYILRDGMLYIALRVDGGIMVFRRAK